MWPGRFVKRPCGGGGRLRVSWGSRGKEKGERGKPRSPFDDLRPVTKTRQAHTSCSISSTSSPKRLRAALMGSGLDMSTPAIFSRLIGSVLLPPERNFL